MKKAQIEMGETIFVTMIIIILIVIGFVFLFSYEQEDAQKTKDEFYELDSITFTQLVSSLPEITCVILGNEQESCFDISRLTAFENILNDESSISLEYYFEKLGNVNITVEQIYPAPIITESDPTPGVWELYFNDFTVDCVSGTCNVQNIGNPLMLPISLYDPVTKQNYFGILYMVKFKKK